LGNDWKYFPTPARHVPFERRRFNQEAMAQPRGRGRGRGARPSLGNEKPIISIKANQLLCEKAVTLFERISLQNNALSMAICRK